MQKRSTLERQMLCYFGLIAVASLFITGEFIWAIHTTMSKMHNITDTSTVTTSEKTLSNVLTSLRNKAFLMFVVQAVVTLIVLIMLIRRITGPLRLMVERARLISEGDLSQTIEVRRHDEIGLLAETINGLTSNLQEIVAFSLSYITSLWSTVEALRLTTRACPESEGHLDEIAVTLAAFRNLLEDFKLFPAPLSSPSNEELSS